MNKERLSYLLIIGVMLAIIILQATCAGKRIATKDKVIVSEVCDTVKVAGDTVEIERYKPVPYKVEVPGPTDTFYAELKTGITPECIEQLDKLFAKYSEQRYYRDSLNFGGAYAIIQDKISFNSIQERSVKFYEGEKDIVTKTQTIEDKGKVVFLLRAAGGYSFDKRAIFGTGIALKTKKDHVFSIDLNQTVNGPTQVMGGVHVPLKLKK